MSNPADCTIGDSVQVKKYNMVKYESLSLYQIKNVKSCWLYNRCLCTSKKYTTWLHMNHCQYIKLSGNKVKFLRTKIVREFERMMYGHVYYSCIKY
jgi:hypothetical protein